MRKIIFALISTPFLLSSDASPPLCESPFHLVHLDVRHTESKGLGYKDGYTTLEGFGIYDKNPDFMPFFDLRGHIFNNGRFAANIGSGMRTYLPSINHTFGFYFYYDVRQTHHHLTVNQLSPGIELLGSRMEYRLNTYFPVGDHESRRYGYKFHDFKGHRVLTRYKKQYALSGGDAEVGVHLTQSDVHDFFVGLGPYYFTADVKSTFGGQARIFWRYKEYLTAQASYSYDHHFKNIVQGQIAASYPLGGTIKREGKNCPNPEDQSLSRLAFSPHRYEIPVVIKKRYKKAAINPATGLPWRAWFVDNTSHSQGTFESPFPTLAQAQNASGPNDLIYVFAGDGTSNGMNAGITLQSGQKLFGAGTTQSLKTSKGTIGIPTFSQTAPLITNSAGSVVFLSDGNEVSGMNILIQQGSGINTPTQGVNGANLHHNILTANVVGTTGISLQGFGTLRIWKNILTAPTTSGGGTRMALIDVLVTNGNYANLRIENNICQGNNFGIRIAPTMPMGFFTTAFGDITIASNFVTAFGNQGIFINIGMPQSNFTILNNTILDTKSSGLNTFSINIMGSSDIDSGTYLIANNTIVTSLTNFTAPFGINIASGSGPDPSFMKVALRNNQISNIGTNNGISVQLSAAANNTLCATMVGNTIQLADPVNMTGFSFSTAGGGMINVDSFVRNVAPNDTSINGPFNFVPPGSCR